MKLFFLLLALLWMPLAAAHAITVDTPLTDTALEARAQQLFASLRCVVCSGQTIADSDVALARDMRQQIRTMLATGAGENDIRAYFVTRYGEEVLTRPPLNMHGIIFWLLPLLVLSAGAFMLHRMMKKGVS